MSKLVSLVLAVKNGLPQIRQTIDGLRRQTYRHFELIVQDGGSTDGTVEYLRSITDLPRVDIDSRPDTGVGQAYNRAAGRARGELVLPIASDETLDDDALEKGLAWFAAHPDAAVIYGAARLAEADGRVVQVFVPPPFDLGGALRSEIVIPACAAFLNRNRIGDDLFYDESIKTCPDYEFWTRLGAKFGPAAIVRESDAIVTARCDRVSSTYRTESYEKYCAEKLAVLDRYLKAHGEDPDLRRTASAGILSWAAESVFQIEGATPVFLDWCRRAAEFDPQSGRLAKLAARSHAFKIDSATGQFIAEEDTQPETPGPQAQSIEGLLSTNDIQVFPYWESALTKNGSLKVTTAEAPWAYAAQIALDGVNWDDHLWHWVKLDVAAQRGQIGIGLLADDNICNERLISPFEGRVSVFVRIHHGSAKAVMIRNGSIPGRSILEVLGLSVEASPKAALAGRSGRN